MGFKANRGDLVMIIKNRTDWKLKTNNKVTVLVLDVEDGVVEFTEDRRVFRLSVYLFLSCFKECEQ